jgi:hypothetical protein
LSFEIQELRDIIRVIVLLSLTKESLVEKIQFKRQVDKYCAGYVCVEMRDVEETLKEMSAEGLLTDEDDKIKLTDRGLSLGMEWRALS